MSEHMNEVPSAASSPIQEMEAQILALIGDSQPIGTDERRVSERFPMSCKMLLTPIDAKASPRIDESSIIFGKDLSRSGICFSHELPLSHRRMIISLAHPEVGQFKVEAEMSWSRQTPIGLYETGCRLIRKVV